MSSSSNPPARRSSSSSSNADDDDYSHSAIIFSRSILQFIHGRQCRLPTTYIGVRRQGGEDPPLSSLSLASDRLPSSSSSTGQVVPSIDVGIVVGSADDRLKEEGHGAAEKDDDDDDSWVVLPTHEIMNASNSSTASGAVSSSVFRYADQHDINNNDDDDDDEGEMIQEQTKVAPIIYRIPTNLDDKTTTTTTAANTTTTTGRRMTTREKKQLKYQVKQAQHAVRKEERQRLHEERISTAKKEKAERKRLKKLA
jgi:hypothetical protein